MKLERYLTQEDAFVLSRLAEQMLRVRDVNLNFAEKLIDLITGSILLPENSANADHVSLGSTVTYRVIGTPDRRMAHIVCPRDADDALARVSILSPVAVAVLGRRIGSIVEVELPFHKVQYIEIVDVARTGSPGVASRQAQGERIFADTPTAERRFY